MSFSYSVLVKAQIFLGQIHQVAQLLTGPGLEITARIFTAVKQMHQKGALIVVVNKTVKMSLNNKGFQEVQ